jgi:hypothetical protein
LASFAGQINRLGGYFLKTPAFHRQFWYAMYTKIATFTRQVDEERAHLFWDVHPELYMPPLVEKASEVDYARAIVHYFMHYHYLLMEIAVRVASGYCWARLSGINQTDKAASQMRVQLLNSAIRSIDNAPLNKDIWDLIKSNLALVAHASEATGLQVFIPMFVGPEDHYFSEPTPLGHAGSPLSTFRRQATFNEIPASSQYCQKNAIAAGAWVPTDPGLVMDQAIPDANKFMSRKQGYFFDSLMGEIYYLINQFNSEFGAAGDIRLKVINEANLTKDFWYDMGFVNGNLTNSELAQFANAMPVADYTEFIQSYKCGSDFNPVVAWRNHQPTDDTSFYSSKLLPPFAYSSLDGKQVRSDLSNEDYFTYLMNQGDSAELVDSDGNFKGLPKELPFCASVNLDKSVKSDGDWVRDASFVDPSVSKLLGFGAASDPAVLGDATAQKAVRQASSEVGLQVLNFSMMSRDSLFYKSSDELFKATEQSKNAFIPRMMYEYGFLQPQYYVTPMLDPNDMLQNQFFTLLNLQPVKADGTYDPVTGSWEHIVLSMNHLPVMESAPIKPKIYGGNGSTVVAGSVDGVVPYAYDLLAPLLQQILLPLGDAVPYPPAAHALRNDLVYLNQIAHGRDPVADSKDTINCVPFRPIGVEPALINLGILDKNNALYLPGYDGVTLSDPTDVPVVDAAANAGAAPKAQFPDKFLLGMYWLIRWLMPTSVEYTPQYTEFAPYIGFSKTFPVKRDAKMEVLKIMVGYLSEAMGVNSNDAGKELMDVVSSYIKMPKRFPSSFTGNEKSGGRTSSNRGDSNRSSNRGKRRYRGKSSSFKPKDFTLGEESKEFKESSKSLPFGNSISDENSNSSPGSESRFNTYSSNKDAKKKDSMKADDVMSDATDHDDKKKSFKSRKRGHSES